MFTRSSNFYVSPPTRIGSIRRFPDLFQHLIGSCCLRFNDRVTLGMMVPKYIKYGGADEIDGSKVRVSSRGLFWRSLCSLKQTYRYSVQRTVCNSRWVFNIISVLLICRSLSATDLAMTASASAISRWSRLLQRSTTIMQIRGPKSQRTSKNDALDRNVDVGIGMG